jgi:hypothetical protein
VKKILLGASLALVATALVVTVAPAREGKRSGNGGGFHAFLTGYEEVPSISTTGVGKFKARLNGDTIEYTLKYRDLEGGAVSAAHIHFAQRGVNGGVSAFLCGGGDKPACPPSGTVTGTIDAADVIGPENKGIAPGEIAELVKAMKAGVTYVNVHTQPPYDGGEIRGQIKGKHGGKHWRGHGFRKNGGDGDRKRGGGNHNGDDH